MGKADKGVDTDSERTVPGDIAGQGLHDGRFWGADGLFVEGCGHKVSGSEIMRRRHVEDRAMEGAVDVSEGELLLGNVFGLLRKRVE